jgi:hypothetical protein
LIDELGKFESVGESMLRETAVTSDPTHCVVFRLTVTERERDEETGAEREAPGEVEGMSRGPQVHDEVGDLEREVALDVVQHEVVARVIAPQHTPLLLHGMLQRDRLEGRRVHCNSTPIIGLLSGDEMSGGGARRKEESYRFVANHALVVGHGGGGELVLLREECLILVVDLDEVN